MIGTKGHYEGDSRNMFGWAVVLGMLLMLSGCGAPPPPPPPPQIGSESG